MNGENGNLDIVWSSLDRFEIRDGNQRSPCFVLFSFRRFSIVNRGKLWC